MSGIKSRPYLKCLLPLLEPKSQLLLSESQSNSLSVLALALDAALNQQKGCSALGHAQIFQSSLTSLMGVWGFQ